MQRTWTNRRIIIFSSIILVLAIALDLLTKVLFVNLYESNGDTVVIEGFFRFTYAENTGSAFSFLADKSWAQIFFKVLTVISLILFALLWVFAYKKGYKTLSFSLALICGGTIGNFVDRLFLGYVRDFIGFTFFGWNFPVFNIADSCLTIGVIMFVVHFLFLDKDAVFKKKEKR